jgi:hypothetical protein
MFIRAGIFVEMERLREERDDARRELARMRAKV